MTPEHTHQPAEPDRPRWTEFIHVQPESSSVISAILDQVDDEQVRFYVLNGYFENGPAFAAYLTLASTNVASTPETLDDEFRRRYKASWSTLAELVDAHAEALGWDEALDAFCADHEIPDRLTAWDKDEFVTWLRRTLDIVPLDGHWHVFSETDG